MSLMQLKDHELLAQTKQLVQKERELVTKILDHLKEVERRKLFSDLGYRSLFEYAVKELKYSEGQAGRRLQAMRLIQELPHIEQKLTSGCLSLTTLSQAQSFFSRSKKIHNSYETEGSGEGHIGKSEKCDSELSSQDKTQLLATLENKSAREAERILLSLQPAALPKEKERPLTESLTEVRFIMSQDLKCQLEEVRSLLGVKGATMSFAELFSLVSQIAIKELKVKKFGKKRTQTEVSKQQAPDKSKARCVSEHPSQKADFVQPVVAAPAPESLVTGPVIEAPTGGSVQRPSSQTRYISKGLRHQIWTRDQGQCCFCGSQRILNIDHIKPVAIGGTSAPDNLRLLCFNCNQRQAMKSLGLNFMQRQSAATEKKLKPISKSDSPPQC